MYRTLGKWEYSPSSGLLLTTEDLCGGSPGYVSTKEKESFPEFTSYAGKELIFAKERRNK
ncbi:hypothetical protein GCM10011409_45210 [Lentibacillus populi]|uniref:Uncharacterized protein n=1 Tax=Lentibacillus populi TaxID=1827502 RepID=A0A9W5U274_9BACI|nr:hypothetical protein GCM10011409_45210 [Lentibacillus populi]